VRLRHLLRVVHRDLGYVCVALTIAYAVSGIAVNHIDDWNPNYRLEQRAVDLGPLPPGTYAEQAAHVVAALRLDPRAVRGHFAETDTTLRVYLDGAEEVFIEIPTGRGTVKRLERRAVLFEVNALHLNNLKGIWTYVADLFAVALMVLALSGMFMMKGDRGLAGRGKYFIAAGLTVPVGFITYLHC
jgi:hypothetical protein